MNDVMFEQVKNHVGAGEGQEPLGQRLRDPRSPRRTSPRGGRRWRPAASSGGLSEGRGVECGESPPEGGHVLQYLIRRIGLGIALLLAGTACAAPLHYIRTSPRAYAARGEPAALPVLYADPLEPYEVLGVIDWVYHQPGLLAYEVPNVFPRLRQKAWEVGGDAIIVRKHVVDADLTRNLQIGGEVIRFKR